MSFSENGFNERENAKTNYDGKEITIRRFENGMIRLYDPQDELLKSELDVRTILREINQLQNLGVNVDKRRTTQQIGRDVIRALNRR